MDKVDIAIMRLQEAAKMSRQIYDKPLIVTDSGGKDSSVCVHLAQKAGIPFEVQHAHTTADAPETVRFVREKFKRMEQDGIKCKIVYPTYNAERISMWSLIAQYGLPHRFRRFCCSLLKETQVGNNRFVVTGVRWDESKKRKDTRGIYETRVKSKKNKIILTNDNDEKRQLFENCTIKGQRICNPIIDWGDDDVWDFIRSERLEVNPLYFDGWNRVGCVGCPLAGTKIRQTEFAVWPKYKNLYIISANKFVEKMKLTKGFFLENVEEYFHYWMEDGVLPGQTNIFDEEGPG